MAGKALCPVQTPLPALLSLTSGFLPWGVELLNWVIFTHKELGPASTPPISQGTPLTTLTLVQRRERKQVLRPVPCRKTSRVCCCWGWVIWGPACVPHPPSSSTLLSTRATQARDALRPQRPCVAGRNLVKPAASWCDFLRLCVPTQAVLKNSGLLLCGAILLDSTWIVSAAHCFDTIRSWRNITVVMGRYGLSLASDQRAFSYVCGSGSASLTR